MGVVIEGECEAHNVTRLISAGGAKPPLQSVLTDIFAAQNR
jgi:hypothetical protein